MDRITLTVHVEYDPEAKVWYTAHSQPLRGCLNLEANTFDELGAKVPTAVADLYEVGGRSDTEVEIEIVGHTRTTVRIPYAA